MCYVLCLQISILTTKGREILAGCLLLILLFLARFYFSKESIKHIFLSGLEEEPVAGEKHHIF
jgi:hypothetical protein